MVYVPSVWVKHNENKKKVTLILEKLDSDIKMMIHLLKKMQ